MKTVIDSRMLMEISNTAGQFVSDIKLVGEGYVIDVKSIMGLLASVTNTRDVIVLRIVGEDREKAKNVMKEVFQEKGFEVSFAA